MTTEPAGPSSDLPSRRTLITGAAGAAALAVTAASGTASAAAPGAADSPADSPAAAGTALAPAATGSDWNACLTVARAILVRDEQDQPLVPATATSCSPRACRAAARAPRRC